ncbi:hypothetical protein QFZ96_002582 [Paraburkholderia youngii]
MSNPLATLSTVGSGSYAPEDVHFLLQRVNRPGFCGGSNS